MTDYSISHDDLDPRPLLNIRAQCGHIFPVRLEEDMTIEQCLSAYGEVDLCAACRQADMQAKLDALDYQLNPDTEALGWARLADAISPLEVTPITDASAGEAADDQEGDEEEGTAP